MGRLFSDFKLKPDFSEYKDAKFWLNRIMDGVGLGLWILLAVKTSEHVHAGFAWGLTFAIVSLSFPNNGFDTLRNWVSLLNGDIDIVKFVVCTVFHFLGAIGANFVAGFIGLVADGAQAPAELTFNTAFSAEFYKFFFSSEFVGLFLFAIFSARSKSDMPSSLWSVLLIAVAFFVGGNSFVFVPARFFNSYLSFASLSSWAGFVCQLWSATVGAIVLEFVWSD